MTRIAIGGCCGRMGMSIASLAMSDPDIELGAVIENEDHPSVGRSYDGIVPDCPKLEVRSDLWKAMGRFDVLIEFTTPDATVLHSTVACDGGAGCVIGTTGLSEAQLKMIGKLSEKVPIVMSPNMSVGVNLVFELVREVASRLGPEYSAEIIEVHHKFKKDAPSGTAKRLAQNIAEARGLSLKKDAVYGRSGMPGERKASEIGIHAVRGGDIVGEHTVVFAGPGERVEIVHRAHSRDTFAHGALKAAAFVHGRAPGLYNMHDVLAATASREKGQGE